MKFISLLSLLLTFSVAANTSHCKVFENGKVSKCEEYPNSKNPDKLKKLCSYNNIKAGPVTIKGVYVEGACDSKEAVAKCKLPKSGFISYYFKAIDLTFEEMEKGCKVFKSAVFTKL